MYITVPGYLLHYAYLRVLVNVDCDLNKNMKKIQIKLFIWHEFAHMRNVIDLLYRDLEEKHCKLSYKNNQLYLILLSRM